MANKINNNNIVNCLPVELLCQVFDHLPVADQKTVTATCSTWNDVMSIERYTNRRMIHLVPYLEAGLDLAEVEHYRCFRIGQLPQKGVMSALTQLTLGRTTPLEENQCPQKMLKALRDFLWSDEVSQHVEELYLEGFSQPHSELFGGEKPLCMPRLRVLSTNVTNQTVENLIAPKLAKAIGHHAGAKNRGPGPLNPAPLMNQLHELKVKFYAPLMVDLPSVIGPSFENLRRLTLENFVRFERRDVAHLKRVAPQLTHLNVSNDDVTFPEILESVLPVARNLQVLQLSVRLFNIGCLAGLKDLRELYLMTYISAADAPLEREPVIKLPNLIKLTTVIGVAARLDTPKLQSLRLGGRHRVTLADPAIVAFMAGFRNNLLELGLSDMELSNACTSRICYTLPRLVRLEMERVIVKPAHVDWILGALPRLRRARFENCRWHDDSTPNKAFYEQLGRSYPKIAIEEEFTSLFPRLGEMIAKGFDIHRYQSKFGKRSVLIG